jgi:N-acetylglutamate synthase-like GNAT family acetyltransferase
MADGLHIRPAREDDLNRLQELYRHLNAHDPRRPLDEAIAVFRRFLLYPGSAILVGTIGSELVTSCTLVVIPNLTRGGKPYALIENMVTRADWRKRGFGSAILKAATEQAWEEGCYKVMLLTGSRKPDTLAFYAAAGFEQSKTGFQIKRYPT